MANRPYPLPVYLIAGKSIQMVAGYRSELVDAAKNAVGFLSRLLSWVLYS